MIQKYIKKVTELAIKSSEVVGDYSHSETILNPYFLTENIINECCEAMEEEDSYYGSWMASVIKKHFGIG